MTSFIRTMVTMPRCMVLVLEVHTPQVTSLASVPTIRSAHLPSTLHQLTTRCRQVTVHPLEFLVHHQSTQALDSLPFTLALLRSISQPPRSPEATLLQLARVLNTHPTQSRAHVSKVISHIVQSITWPKELQRTRLARVQLTVPLPTLQKWRHQVPCRSTDLQHILRAQSVSNSQKSNLLSLVMNKQGGNTAYNQMMGISPAGGGRTP